MQGTILVSPQRLQGLATWEEFGENGEMELANLWFSPPSQTLEQQLAAVRELGFHGLGLLAGGFLPPRSRADVNHAASGLGADSGRVSVLSLALLDDEEDSAEPAWRRVSVPQMVHALRSLSCSQLLIPCGLDARKPLQERASKLTARVAQGERLDPSEEALEQVLVEAGVEMERQLEPLVAFLYDLRKAAPGLRIALRPEISAASLLDPVRFRMLLEELPDAELGYWHDVGVTEMRAFGGMEAPGAWLDAFGSRIQGTTLHDFAGGAMHLPPGIGTVDWPLLAEYLPRQAGRVLAVAPSYPGEVLVEARTTLDSRLPA